MKNGSSDNFSRFTLAMYVYSIASPILYIGIVVMHAIVFGVSEKITGAGFILFLGGCHASRFLYRRSKNLEAYFGPTRVSPSDPEGEKFILDIVVMTASIAILVLSACMPFFG